MDKGGTIDKLRSVRGDFVTENGAEKPRKKFAQNGTPEHVKRPQYIGYGTSGGHKEKHMSSQKIRIKLRAYDHELVDSSAQRIVDAAKQTGSKVCGPIPLPTQKEVVTILRSVHKHKDSREQFELRTYSRLIDIYSPSGKTVDSLMKLDLPAGVDIKIKL